VSLPYREKGQSPMLSASQHMHCQITQALSMTSPGLQNTQRFQPADTQLPTKKK